MYICNCCGHKFEEGDEAVWTEPHGERFAGCPVCCGDFSKLHECRKCGEVEDVLHMHDGLCEDCIKDMLNLQLFHEFISNFENGLKDFIFSMVFECDEIPVGGNDELDDFVNRVFTRKSYEDALNNSRDFLDKCVKYILSDKPFADTFAIWMRKRSEKNVHS